jgi:hypothetical protein
VLRFAVLAVLIVSALAAPPAAYGVTLAGADDGALVYHPERRAAALDAMQVHGVTVVRTIDHMQADQDAYVSLAADLAARGLTLRASMMPANWTTPDEFADDVVRQARALAATGVSLRLSLLNEPDLGLSVGEADCDDPTVVSRSLASVDLDVVERQVRVKVRRTRVVVRVVRRHGKRTRVRRVVAVSRLTSRHGRRVRVPVFRYVMRTQRLVESHERTDTNVTLTPRRGCFAVQRARRAASLMRAAIPALRSALPDVQIDAGEVSPVAGVTVYLAELARQRVPAVDGAAMHPYPAALAGWDSSALPLERFDDAVTLLHRAFGDVPVDVTEFGQMVGSEPDAAWARAMPVFCSAGAREVTAYQWDDASTGLDSGWNTSLLAPGLVDTPRGETFTHGCR